MAGGFNIGAIHGSMRLDKGQWDRSVRSVRGDADRLKGKLAGISKVAVFAGATAGGLALTKVLKDAVQASIEFESSFAGVRKTVNATETEFSRLSRSIRDMSLELPVNVNELNRIGESAGQLGVKVQNIEKFIDTMAKLGVATNLSSEQAATSFARFANIMQFPIDQVDKLGSVVVELGNNLATTESEIVGMSLRLAGAGKQIGLLEQEVFALAGALSSVGINAEAGGSAFSRIMFRINQAVRQTTPELQLFAAIANQSQEEFRELFSNDAAEAIASVVEGLGQFSEAGGNAVEVLESLGIQEIRSVDALNRLSGAGDLFRDALRRANAELKGENGISALTKEVGERFDTTASKVALLKNEINELFITIGDSIPLKGVLDTTTQITKSLKNLIQQVEFWHRLRATPSSVFLDAARFAMPEGHTDTGVSAESRLGFLLPREESNLDAINDAVNSLGQSSKKSASAMDTLAAAGDGLVRRLDPVADLLATTTEGLEALHAIGRADADMLSRFGESLFEDFGERLGKDVDEAIALIESLAPDVARAFQRALIESMDQPELFADDKLVGQIERQVRSGKNLFGFLTGQGQIRQAQEDLQDLEFYVTQIRDAGSVSGEELNLLATNFWRQMGDVAITEMQTILEAVDDPKLKEAFQEALASVKENRDDLAKAAKFQGVSDSFRELSFSLRGLGPNFRDAAQAAQTASRIMSIAANAVAGNWLAVAQEGLAVVIESLGLLESEGEKTKNTFERVQEEIAQSVEQWADRLTDAIVDFVKTGKTEFKDLVDSILEDLLRIAIQQGVMQPIMQAFGVKSFAKGGVLGHDNIVPFAKGAMINRPTVFPMAEGLGLAGEKGREAIFPLTRIGGDLGIKAQTAPVTVNVIDQRRGGSPVSVSESTGTDGQREIQVLIRDAVKQQINEGGFDDAFRRNFRGIQRQGIAR